MTPDLMGTRHGLHGARNPRWELSPNAPGILADVARKDPATGVRPPDSAHALRGATEYSFTTEYDEVDRRLMDTFPASDAVGRY